MSAIPVEALRRQFPALSRHVGEHQVCHFDGPAGSQVPLRVAQAVSNYLLTTNANRGAPFVVARESDQRLDAAHKVLADFLGTDDPDGVIFGLNMTTLTLSLSRALARTWKPEDEIIVTQLDHDANVTPWVLAAQDAGATVRRVPVRLDDCTLDRDAYRSFLNERTRLVAVGYASNATGTINPVRGMIAEAHAVGALTFVDAVHIAPHRLIDVTRLGCDFLCCSAYKFFGPHVGILYGKRNLLESIEPYQLRPSPNELPGRWMTGTQSHEGIVGAAEAVEYLADIGRVIQPSSGTRREALQAAFAAIETHETDLSRQFLEGLAEMPSLRVWGITEPARLGERVPTFSLTHLRRSPKDLAAELASEGLFCWPGNHYALPFTEAAGLEPHGTLRAGFVHYNDRGEIARLVGALRRITGEPADTPAREIA